MDEKKVIILGITGSIGESSLKIIRENRNRFQIVGFSYHANFEKAALIQKEFEVPYLVCTDSSIEKSQLNHWKEFGVQLFSSMENLLDIDYDLLITGVVGSIGIRPTLKAIKQDKTILLANKETLVMAGDLVIRELQNSQAQMIPVDSEHSSVFRMIKDKTFQPEKIILTASGGALREYTSKQIKEVGIKDVLNHPTWNMGQKITVDSAGMINKALEVIEAHHLFQFPFERIDAVIHPQSYIHAMVGWKDGSFDLHVSKPSMIYPIAYGLFYPQNSPQITPPVLTENLPAFEFHSISQEKYPGFFLGLEAGKKGSVYSTVFNAANEVAVNQFLQNKIDFYQIPLIIEKVLSVVPDSKEVSQLEDYEKMDVWARKMAQKTSEKSKKNFIL